MRGPQPEDLASAFDSLVSGTIIHWLYEAPGEPLHARMLRAAEILLGGIAMEPLAKYTGPVPVLYSPDETRGRAPRARAPRPGTRRRR